jgi:hypothetical protein
MSYPAPSQFFRSPAQKKDMFLSWKRSDREFFGGGACHILAYLFYDLHRGEDYDIIYTRPLGLHPGHHVYCYKDGWVFDTAGWTREDEVLRVMREDYTKRHSDWDIERTVITDMQLEDFCEKYYHRSPAYFPYLPWERAYEYIKKFEKRPPNKAA